MKIFLSYLVLDSPQDTGYSYGLGYLSAVLRQAGYPVCSSVIKDEKSLFLLYERIKEEKPEIVGFSATTSQFNHLAYIAKAIKKIHPSFIVCGGIHPTLKPDCLFEVPELDAIVRGEGEFPMRELAAALEGKTSCHEIKNMWFKEKGAVINNELRPFIKDLDELPFPDKSSLDYQQAIDDSRGVNRFIFSRGCTFDCAYCSNKALTDLQGGAYYRRRSPQKAIDEISIDAERYSFQSIIFDDDIICLDKDWFYRFFSSYKKVFTYPFLCNIRPATIDADMVRLLKEAGARGVIIGIEHGNEEFRKNVLKRNITNKQIVETFRLFDQYGIKYRHALVMTGLPFENRKLFLDTVRMCRRLRTTNRSIAIFQPYPATELHETCEKNDWLPREKYYREREKALISYPGFSKEEIQLCHDSFRYLLQLRFLPLSLPMEYFLFLGIFLKKARKRFLKTAGILKFQLKPKERTGIIR